MILLSILSGLGALGNYYALVNGIYTVQGGIIIQGILLLAALVPLITFKGKKSRPSYSEWGVSYFTVRFAVRLLSLFGNVVIFIVIILNLTGRIQNL